ncbi:AAA family ATPase [Micromonospora sp. NPDC050200]|uniref:AAA family ATPase n=1 Tax=Micromonospora sp. NPDC050200 TaxID=3155664 RepID=UPI0033E76421
MNLHVVDEPEDDDAFEEISPLGRVLTLSDLMKLPAPEPLIKGLVSHRSAVLMVGATGSNKTFAVVGLGCSVATGKPWLEHKVAVRGHVVFVVGEGAHGLAGRIAAWEEHHGVEVPHRRVSFVLKPTSLMDPAFWDHLTRHAQEKRAALVILDTFSSLAPEADETKDAATVMRRLSDLAAEIDGTAVLVHHTGWGPQDRARGGSQFESNADEVLVMEKLEPTNPTTVVSLRRKKTKEEESGRTVNVRRKLVGRSAVLEVVEGDTPQKSAVKDKREAVKREILDLLEADPYVFTKTQARFEVSGKVDIFNEVWRGLEDGGLILSRVEKKDDDRQAQRYWATAPVEELA